MQRMIIVGSPRSGGRCAHLAEALMEARIEDFPDDGLDVVSVGSLFVGGCMGCDGCRPEEPTEEALPCVLDDDFADIRMMLDEADELEIVTPVYFCGVPSQLKAWVDRLQPYYWTELRHGALRPARLHIVGEGADPFGFQGVIDTVRSALLCAGFDVDEIYSWVGKIDDEGTIIADADVIASPYGADQTTDDSATGEDRSSASPAAS